MDLLVGRAESRDLVGRINELLTGMTGNRFPHTPFAISHPAQRIPPVRRVGNTRNHVARRAPATAGEQGPPDPMDRVFADVQFAG